jgi:hypothetical protein
MQQNEPFAKVPAGQNSTYSSSATDERLSCDSSIGNSPSRMEPRIASRSLLTCRSVSKICQIGRTRRRQRRRWRLPGRTWLPARSRLRVLGVTCFGNGRRTTLGTFARHPFLIRRQSVRGLQDCCRNRHQVRVRMRVQALSSCSCRLQAAKKAQKAAVSWSRVSCRPASMMGELGLRTSRMKCPTSSRIGP